MVMPIVMPPGGVPRKLPRITIDNSKCTVPFLCKKCLLVCPEAVLAVRNDADRVEKLKELDPRIDGNYVMDVPYRNKCTMCNKCVDVCPVDAITIELPAS